MYSIIDIGSNTIRLKVYAVDGAKIKTVFQSKDMTGLANYIGEDHRMSGEGIERAGAVLREYVGILDRLGIGHRAVFATASLRNIVNTAEAAEALSQAAGCPVDVISGRKEAVLDYVGATWGRQSGSGLIVDIGGGSTELTFFDEGSITRAVSLPIGSLNMFTSRVEWLLPTGDERAKIQKRALREIRAAAPELPPRPVICGVGGTARACLRLAQATFKPAPQDDTLSAFMLGELLRRYSQPSRETLRALLRTVPERIHTILPGMIILSCVVQSFGSECIQVSRYGVREGYLISEVLGLRRVDEHELDKP